MTNIYTLGEPTSSQK